MPVVTIDAKGVYYRYLNEMVRQALSDGAKEIHLKNVNGQYYIGAGLRGDARIVIDGVPGQDLGAFMDGPTIIVYGNGQDNIANTMNSGKIIVHGHAGDVLGYGMRGGELFVRGDVGYRVGIHMKGYQDQIPILIAGGKAGDFFGEYMAGGVLALLGLNQTGDKRPLVGDYLGTGMHGGTIYIRGEVERSRCGKEVGISIIEPGDDPILKPLLEEFCHEFGFRVEEVTDRPFSKLVPVSSRPYGKLYTY